MPEVSLGAALIVGPNRLDQLKRLLPQLADFDQIVVVNTSGQGAVKNYVKRLGKKYEYHEYTWRSTPFAGDGSLYGLNDWGFSGARNESFKHLKTTHAVWLDTDDMIGVKYQGKDIALPPKAAADALRKIASEAPDTDVWFADYVYSRDEYGNPNVVHARERLVRLECGWRWVYPIHECLVPNRQPVPGGIRDVQIIHYPEEAEEPSTERNLRMLKLWYDQLLALGGSDRDLGRCRLQIGETYWGAGEYLKAGDWLENEYLAKHPTAIDLEKWTGACFACKSYISIGALKDAERMALKALSIEPGLPDGYLLLAQVKYLAEGDPQDVLELIDIGGRKDDPPPEVIKNPLDYTFTPFCITSACKYKLGDYEQALDKALLALKLVPNDPRAESLRLQAAYKMREQQGTQAAIALYQLLADFDEHQKAAELFEYLPYPVQRQAVIHKMAGTTVERVEHLLNPDKYKDFFSSPPNWEPVPWNFFEEGKIPGGDRYRYILGRLKQRPDVSKVLVVGCEDGFHALLLAKEGYEVTGIDLNPEAIRVANERAEKLGVNAKFVVGWMEDNTLDGEWEAGFDAIVASDQIDKARDVSFFLATLGDCLRPGGLMLLTTPDGAWDQGDHPYNQTLSEKAKTVRAFRQDTLEALLRNGGNEFWVTECHFLPYSGAYRENQGWQVAEVVKTAPPSGPRIRIFVGELAEEFTPASLELGGTGGSETAVIWMSHFWARMGCQVVVYGSSVGIFDGVLYRYADDFSHKLESDIFISWRLPQVFGKGRPNAKLTVLWNHDVFYPSAVPQEWMEHMDQIVVLSEFHKSIIQDVHQFPEDKIWISRNGIDPLRYRQQVERKKYNYFFSSSHDRGLSELLEIWPQIKKAIPEATLNVGYGTLTASKIAKQKRDSDALDLIRRVESELYEMPGVVYHGRLSQRELARLQLECEAWLYPYQHDEKWGTYGGFLETYCITAVEAQAAGAVPITRLNGALPETVKYCIEWKKEWTTDDVIEVLKNLDDLVDRDALESAQTWALSQTWQSLAFEWLKHFASFANKEETQGE